MRLPNRRESRAFGDEKNARACGPLPQTPKRLRRELRTRIFSPIQGVPCMTEHTLTGNIQQHPDFDREFCGNGATFWFICRPVTGVRDARRYPVLYLHDGQNVFDAATAFGGVEWGVDETAQRLIAAELDRAAHHRGGREYRRRTHPRIRADRVDDRRNARSAAKGCCGKYGRFLIEELKPFIDRKYRTRPEAESTGLGGSSLGGLATLALGLWFPNVFTRLAGHVASVWWDDCAIYGMVDELERQDCR